MLSWTAHTPWFKSCKFLQDKEKLVRDNKYFQITLTNWMGLVIWWLLWRHNGCFEGISGQHRWNEQEQNLQLRPCAKLLSVRIKLYIIPCIASLQQVCVKSGTRFVALLKRRLWAVAEPQVFSLGPLARTWKMGLSYVQWYAADQADCTRLSHTDLLYSLFISFKTLPQWGTDKQLTAQM